MSLLTKQEALDHLRVDDATDPVIDDYITAASAAILAYVGDGAYKDPDATPRVVREDVQAACKLLVGDFYRNRESQSPDRVDAQHGYGYLPSYVVALLFPYRKLVAI